jgi:leucyl aminopeptidase
MAGMSRDKGGAAAVAGFMLSVARLGLSGVKVIAELGVVRNSIGPDSFVADEIIASHAGVRVRIGNTDAEGRLVLADLLSHLREDARQATAPRLFSVATLTGHASRAVGPYNIALDNGPARAAGVAEALSKQGDQWGDPFEVSRLRREDYDFVAPRSRADDLLSCNNLPSSATPRGHQFPMAFLAIASGLDRHGSDAAQPLAFTHIDIGGSGVEGSDWQHGRPSARPLVAMLAALT